MNNILKFESKSVTPEKVVEALKEDLPQIGQIYAIVFRKPDGQPLFYSSGNIVNLCHASVIFNDIAQHFVRGDFE